MSAVCAIIGSAGVLVLTFLVNWINQYNFSKIDLGNCTMEMIHEFDSTCLNNIFALRRKGIWWNQFSNMLIMLLGITSCVCFFSMEDLFDHPSSTVMRNALILGTVLEIMKNAFEVSTRTAAGVTSMFFPTQADQKKTAYISMQVGFSILRNCFTWVTFLRDAILAVGVYLATVFDNEANIIGGSWRTVGWITSIVGVVNTVFELLKLVNYSFFDEESNFTYYLFLICFTVWMCIYGMHCWNLGGGSEQKGMLDEDASSGAEVSDDEPVAAPKAAAPASEEEEEEEEEAPKKKRRHHRKQESSDDDV